MSADEFVSTTGSARRSRGGPARPGGAPDPDGGSRPERPRRWIWAFAGVAAAAAGLGAAEILAALIGPTGDLIGVGSLQVEHASPDGEVTPMNMCAPAELLQPILDDLIRGRPVRPPRPWL